MNTCSTCKHWNPDQVEERIEGVGICQRIPMLHECTEFNWDTMMQEIRMDMKPECVGALAFTQDGSDYRADFFTLPNFGCVMWESKK